MKFVYILVCIADPTRHYVGLTDDVQARLASHNARKVAHTSKYAPWRLSTFIGFTDHARAVAFERYLKSRSGRAFSKKRL